MYKITEIRGSNCDLLTLFLRLPVDALLASCCELLVLVDELA